jgi:DNA anti-recombination protein RmuC
MPDVNERFDRVEERLTSLGERMEEQFAKVDERFAKVDERFAKVDERFAKVDERFDKLAEEVRKLRVLSEDNAAQTKIIAEVQAHHGTEHGAALKRLEEAMKPLTVLSEAIQRVIPDHERRITALEEVSSRTTREP